MPACSQFMPLSGELNDMYSHPPIFSAHLLSDIRIGISPHPPKIFERVHSLSAVLGTTTLSQRNATPYRVRPLHMASSDEEPDRRLPSRGRYAGDSRNAKALLAAKPRGESGILAFIKRPLVPFVRLLSSIVRRSTMARVVPTMRITVIYAISATPCSCCGR